MDRLIVLAAALLEDHFEYWDTDALTREEILIAAGLLERTTASAEDAEQDWAREHGIEAGDPCTKITGAGREVIARAAETERRPPMPRPPSPLPIRRRVENGCYRKRSEVKALPSTFWTVVAIAAFGLAARIYFVWWP